MTPSSRRPVSHHDDDGHDATPVDGVDFTVVDLETTGLSADRGDRVCEVGLVRIRGGAVMETFGTLIDPTIPVSAGAYAVNGISPAMLAGAPQFPEVLPKITSMLAGSVLVAYNAPFDVSFLNSEFRLGGAPVPANTVVDVLALARQLLPGRPKYAQSAVAALLSISYPIRHRAIEDAMVTSKILMHFLSMLKAYGRGGDVRDLTRKDLGRSIGGQRAEKIAQALASGGDIWIRYLSPSDGEVTQRIVTPIRGAAGAGAPTAALEAFCHVLQARRTFRLDYILDVHPVEVMRE